MELGKTNAFKCPHCGAVNDRSVEIDNDMTAVGKSVITCVICGKWFLLRDDGDGEFITHG